MTYKDSTYQGDNDYVVNCTGDCVTGDQVRFERATFTGSYRNAKFAGFELVTGEIINDSYGAEKQQHTFTIQAANGDKIRIKGRNLYKNNVYRKTWDDESLRTQALIEKHQRGRAARSVRDLRREQSQYF